MASSRRGNYMPLCICGTVLTDVRGTDEQIRWATDTSLPHAASGRRIHRDGGIVETAKYCFLCRDCRDGCRDCWFLCRDCRDGKVKEGHLDDSNSLTVPTVPTQKPTVPTTVPNSPYIKTIFCRLYNPLDRPYVSVSHWQHSLKGMWK